MLCREARIGYWFFVVTSGSVRLTRKGKPCATLGPGSHFGDVAILGFGPQAMTATAVVDATIFVLGRRSVLDLTYPMLSFQRGLFPDVPPAEFRQKVRELRAAGEAEWRAMPQGRKSAAAGRGELLPPSVHTFPSRGARRGESPFAVLLRGAMSGTERTGSGRAVPRPLDRRLVAGAALLVVAAALTFGFAFHPGVLVVRPAPTVDVTGDIDVDGLAVQPPRGRYLVTAVNIEDVHLFGAVQAMLSGHHTIPAASGDAADEDRRIGRSSYLGSQTDAVRLIATRVGVDPDRVRVRFRDRQLSGPSAGLLYALLLADMTGQVKVPDGKVVAATGVLGDDGRILPVGYVEVKRQAAGRAHADVFLVPDLGAPATTKRRSVVPVPTFDAAVRALEDSAW